MTLLEDPSDLAFTVCGVYHPWRHLRRLFNDGVGTTLSIEPTPGDRPAWYSPAADHILMRPDLLQVERRCSLAHELAHKDLGHSGTCTYPDSRRQGARTELAADRLAARRLIALPAFIDALCWSDDRSEVAEMLWVTERILNVRIDAMYGGEQETVRAALVARGVA